MCQNAKNTENQVSLSSGVNIKITGYSGPRICVQSLYWSVRRQALSRVKRLSSASTCSSDNTDLTCFMYSRSKGQSVGINSVATFRAEKRTSVRRRKTEGIIPILTRGRPIMTVSCLSVQYRVHFLLEKTDLVVCQKLLHSTILPRRRCVDFLHTNSKSKGGATEAVRDLLSSWLQPQFSHFPSRRIAQEPPKTCFATNLSASPIKDNKLTIPYQQP